MLWKWEIRLCGQPKNLLFAGFDSGGIAVNKKPPPDGRRELTKSGVFGIMGPEGRCYIQIGGWLTVWTPERILDRGR